MVGPPRRSRPPKQLADVGGKLPSHPGRRGQPCTSSLALSGRTHRVFGELWPAPRKGARNQGAAPSLPVAPLFRPRLPAGAGAAGSPGSLRTAGRGGRSRPYLVLIVTRSVSVHSGRARRSPQVQSAKSPGKNSEPQASVSSMGAQRSAASLGALGLAQVGSARLRDWPRAARPPLFLPSTLHPLPGPVSVPPRLRQPPGAGPKPAAPLRVTKPAAAIGAGRPRGAGSRCHSPRAARLPRFPGRRASGRRRRTVVRGPCAPTSCAPAAAGPGSGGKGQGSRGLCSVTADATPPLRSAPALQKKCPAPATALLSSPAPGEGAGPPREPGRRRHSAESPPHQARGIARCERCGRHLWGKEGDGPWAWRHLPAWLTDRPSSFASTESPGNGFCGPEMAFPHALPTAVISPEGGSLRVLLNAAAESSSSPQSTYPGRFAAVLQFCLLPLGQDTVQSW